MKLLGMFAELVGMTGGNESIRKPEEEIVNEILVDLYRVRKDYVNQLENSPPPIDKVPICNIDNMEHPSGLSWSVTKAYTLEIVCVKGRNQELLRKVESFLRYANQKLGYNLKIKFR